MVLFISNFPTIHPLSKCFQSLHLPRMCTACGRAAFDKSTEELRRVKSDSGIESSFRTCICFDKCSICVIDDLASNRWIDETPTFVNLRFKTPYGCWWWRRQVEGLGASFTWLVLSYFFLVQMLHLSVFKWALSLLLYVFPRSWHTRTIVFLFLGIIEFYQSNVGPMFDH